jgi:DNA-nicking Smr family endonuclease
MEVLDLHGYNHSEAEVAVEDFILTAVLPAEIITGNSEPMRKVAKKIVARNGMQLFQKNPSNFGSFIVLEKKIW